MTKVAPIHRSYSRDASECGHGTCAAQVECTGKCAMKSLPVIDPKFLDEQKFEASLRNSCISDDLPVRFAGDEPGDHFWWKWALSAIGGGLLIAVLFYVSTK